MRFDEPSVGKQLAIAMNGAAARRVPLARRHLEEIAAIERKDGLNESFAEARGAENERAIMILRRASDDLGRGCGRAVDEYHQWNVAGEVLPARPRDFGWRISRANADDLLTFWQKETTHGERLVADTAAIVAHVEDNALGALLLQLLDRRRDLLGGLLVEGLQGDVADVAIEDGTVGDGGHVHDGPGEVQFDGLGHTGPAIGDRHLRPGIAAELLGDLVDLPVVRRHTVDCDDAVAFLNACFLGRRMREDALHADIGAGLLLEEHPRAAVSAIGTAIERVALLRRQQLTVGVVELADHSARGLLEYLAILE